MRWDSHRFPEPLPNSMKAATTRIPYRSKTLLLVIWNAKNLKEAKLVELQLRKEREHETWDKVFEITPIREIEQELGDDEPGVEGGRYFKKMAGEECENNSVTNNLAIWAQAMQGYIFH